LVDHVVVGQDVCLVGQQAILRGKDETGALADRPSFAVGGVSCLGIRGIPGKRSPKNRSQNSFSKGDCSPNGEENREMEDGPFPST
ncbi:MAG TPA: hypothetical protein DHV85_13935, partial [Candidatus Accumulibacter sp.]|nr:hypothetical protein [Accumulibacter sp.]